MASELLLELKALMEQEIPPYPPIKNVTEILSRLCTAIGEGGPFVRQELIEQEAYKEITNAWTMYCDTGEMNVREFSPQAEEIRYQTLRALYTLTAGFPDIMDARGFIMIKQGVDTRVPESTQIMALKLMRNICIKSEENRGILTTFARIVQPLVRLIKKNKPSSEFVREWCSTIKALTLSDDKRVAYNRSSERKRLIYQHNTLRYLSQYLNDFKDGPTLNSIVIILASMACCEDYCLDMQVGGVLPAICKILSTMHSNSLLAKNTLSLLRFLNISSIVREKVCSYGMMEHVVKLAYLYRNRADILEIALSCIAFMTLKCPCHVVQFLKESGVEKIMEIIPLQTESRPVLKGACFILRNVAVHGRKEGRKEILAADGENILHQIKEKHPDLKRNYTKPALRDLGVPVSPTIPPATISEELISASIGKPGESFSNQEKGGGLQREEGGCHNDKIPYPPTSALFDYPPDNRVLSTTSVCPVDSQQLQDDRSTMQDIRSAVHQRDEEPNKKSVDQVAHEIRSRKESEQKRESLVEQKVESPTESKRESLSGSKNGSLTEPKTESPVE